MMGPRLIPDSAEEQEKKDQTQAHEKKDLSKTMSSVVLALLFTNPQHCTYDFFITVSH